MITCSNCGEENPPKFRLCGFCGTPLQVAAPAQEVRKLVSILFCDLKGSTSLGESLDPESLREVMNRYFEVMSAAITRHGGTIEKYIGDAVMAVFGLPKVHEDDALRAVRAAHAMQDGLRELNVELEQSYGVTLANRIGVNSGGVVAGDATTNQRLVTGDPVNVAARLEQAAGDTETLIGQLTYRLVAGSVVVEEVEPLTLKGKAQPVPAYRLIDVRAPNGNGAVVRRALLGRHVELQILIDLLDESAARPTPRTMVVIGEAGVGKTRLVDEFAGVASHRALVLRGRCLSYGEGITFWPIVEALRNAASILDEDDAATATRKLREFIGEEADLEMVDRVASTLGLGATTYPVAEIFFGLRRLIEWFALERPVVLVIEDLHWAEPTLHDLLDSLATAGTSAGAMILATARPDVLEKRAQLADVPSLTLDRLGVEETSAMVQELLGGLLDKIGLERVVEASSGNPLFAQQLISMLRDEGQLVPEGDGWRLSTLPEGWLPPTIHALLSSRIDRLEPAQRSVLDPAAVIGHIFPLPAVVEMVEQLTMPDVTAHADELTRTQFLTLAPERDEDFRAFHHAFIRDSVYESLLKRQRATLHEQFVKWADVVNGDRAQEYEEILGYHLEQSHRFLSELAPADDHVRELGADGGRRLASAGRRAFVRGDVPAAANLLGRALALLAPDAPERFARAPDLGDALMQLGDFQAAETVVTAAERDALAAGVPELAGGARIVREFITLFSGAADERWSDDAYAVGEEVVKTAAGRDPAGVARAYRLMGLVKTMACQCEAAADAFHQAMDAAHAAGDIKQERRAAGAYAQNSTYGPIDVEEALARCADATQRSAGDRHAEANVLCYAGHLEAMRGDFELGRDLCRRARARFEELALRFEAAAMVLESSHVEMLAGDPVAAEQELRRGFEVLTELGEGFVRSSVAGLLARALVDQGRLDEAEEMTVVAEELSAADDIDAHVIWRIARARVLAARGSLDEAEALVRQALDLVEPTDYVVVQIIVCTDAAAILRLQDRSEADELFERARRLAEAKGSTAHLARVLDVVAATAGT
jgi:class 3 adenylate cyclase/tetratricopeptide (TPR) repeat protein